MWTQVWIVSWGSYCKICCDLWAADAIVTHFPVSWLVCCCVYMCDLQSIQLSFNNPDYVSQDSFNSFFFFILSLHLLFLCVCVCVCVCVHATVCPHALFANFCNGWGHQLSFWPHLLRNRKIGVSANREGFSHIFVRDCKIRSLADRRKSLGIHVSLQYLLFHPMKHFITLSVK